MQGGEVACRSAARTIAVYQWRQMLALKADRGRVHYYDALNYVAQFTNVAWPGIAHERIDSIIADFARAAAVSHGKFLPEMTPQQRNTLLSLQTRRLRDRER